MSVAVYEVPSVQLALFDLSQHDLLEMLRSRGHRIDDVTATSLEQELDARQHQREELIGVIVNTALQLQFNFSLVN